MPTAELNSPLNRADVEAPLEECSECGDPQQGRWRDAVSSSCCAEQTPPAQRAQQLELGGARGREVWRRQRCA